MDNTLSREERLRSKRALERLFGQGKGGFVYPFRYTCLIGGRPDADTDADADAGADAGAGVDADAAADAAAAVQSQAVRPASVLFSVPKRFHKRANKRNLLRRRTREAYRLNKSLLAEAGVCGAEIALVYSVKEVVDYKRIENAVKRILSQIAKHM